MVDRVRGNAFALISDAAIDLPNEFSPIVPNLHVQLSLTKFSLNS
jgi:hypothetical protein